MWLQALAAVAGAVLPGILGNEDEDRAADAEVEASDRAQELNRYFFDESNRRTEPFRQAGLGALNQRNALLGLPQVSDEVQTNTGAAAAAAPTPAGPEGTVKPATGANYTGPNFGQYFADNNDLQQYWNDNQSQLAATFGTPERMAEHHYYTFGQGEGRPLPEYGGPEAAAIPAGSGDASAAVPGTVGAAVPGTVSVGGGAAQPGGDPANALVTAGTPAATTTPAPTGPDGIAQAQDDAYSVFENSGHARSMLETTNADFDRILGAYGAGGSSLSGSAVGALNDRNRRNTNTAFNQYDGALAGISGTGAGAAGQQSANALSTGNSLASAEAEQGVARGSSYRSRFNPYDDALNSASEQDWGFK